MKEIEISNQTPIEIVLRVDNDGKTTARALYNFLELADGKFTRWAKANITENEFAIDGEDYTRKDIDVPAPMNGMTSLEDYRITASFAKKLCMISKTPKGDEARNYFIKVEDALKELAQTRLIQPYDNVKSFSLGEVSNLLKVLVSVMQKQNSTGSDVAEQVKLTCGQFGIKTISNFVRPLPYEQMTLIANAN